MTPVVTGTMVHDCSFSNMSFVLHSSSYVFAAKSLGFTNLGEIFACMTICYPKIEVVTFHLRRWCTLGVGFVFAGIHQSKT